MIVIYGPAGSGKSTQGQLVAKKLGRKWLSAGEIIRNSDKFREFTEKGAMIDEETLVGLIAAEVMAAGEQDVVFDGQPGSSEQFGLWQEMGLTERLEGVAVLRVPREECLKRLSRRGREDDRMEVWERKLDYFEQKIYSFLAPMKEANVPVYEIDGSGEPVVICERILQSFGFKDGEHSAE